jgi:hypothetical protein
MVAYGDVSPYEFNFVKSTYLFVTYRSWAHLNVLGSGLLSLFYSWVKIFRTRSLPSVSSLSQKPASFVSFTGFSNHNESFYSPDADLLRQLSVAVEKLNYLMCFDK